MVENPRPEDYGTEFRSLSSNQGGVGGLAKTLIVMVALAAFAALGWFGYGFLAPAIPAGEPPLIKADANPIKRRPADPGGIDPPHQDKTVYDQVSPGQSGEVVEKLLPPPETPITPSPTEEITDTEEAPDAEAATEPEQVADSEQAGDIGSAGETADDELPPAEEIVPAEEAPSEPAQVGETESAAEPTVERIEETPVAETQPEPVPEQPATAPAAAPPAEETPTQTVAVPKATPPQPTGGFRIQVAAMRSPEAAEKAWARLQKKHGEVLGGLEFFMQRVDLGEEKGVFFRVQGGPLPDRASASDICARLRERDVGCLVVKG